MSKQTPSPLQRFRRKYCDGCSYHDACLSDKSIELRCLLAALLDAWNGVATLVPSLPKNRHIFAIGALLSGKTLARASLSQ